MAQYDSSLAQASDIAVEVDRLFFFLVALGGAAVVLLTVLIVMFCMKYRRGAPALRRGRLPEAREKRWEWGWTIVPLGVYLGLFAWGAWLYLLQQAPPRDALEIHVLGKQWMWKFQHPGGQREINALHLPAGKPVRLVMTSKDVIHSFYVPAFRVKQDVVPGRHTGVSFTPLKTGHYRLFCAEYCGTSHARMGGAVVVMEPDRYAAWLARHAPSLHSAVPGSAPP